MRGTLPSAGAGILSAAAIYGLLAALEPAPEPTRDPWETAWTEAGFPVEAGSSRPAEHSRRLPRDVRKSLPRFETIAREYRVNQVPAEVIEFPTNELLEEAFPQGRTVHSHRKKRIHAARVGRYLLLLEGWIRVPPLGIPAPVLGEVRERIMVAFERAARGSE